MATSSGDSDAERGEPRECQKKRFWSGGPKWPPAVVTATPSPWSATSAKQTQGGFIRTPERGPGLGVSIVSPAEIMRRRCRGFHDRENPGQVGPKLGVMVTEVGKVGDGVIKIWKVKRFSGRSYQRRDDCGSRQGQSRCQVHVWVRRSPDKGGVQTQTTCGWGQVLTKATCGWYPVSTKATYWWGRVLTKAMCGWGCVSTKAMCGDKRVPTTATWGWGRAPTKGTCGDGIPSPKARRTKRAVVPGGSAMRGVGRARGGHLCDVGSRQDGEVRGVGWVQDGWLRGVHWARGGQLRDTGPGRDECERDSEDQATVDPCRHMGTASCVSFHGSIKAPLGIIRRSCPPSSQFGSKTHSVRSKSRLSLYNICRI
ncbi:hypothetical protein DFH07DRAFT_767577 [Mycena maculata]|uniref:Uncharacterized protein n=1 Tax=Mycena maculata TaxID=230809 RepID=A0AAD7JXA3_9AGAR|nr:hypothetical protein DFH07DRAFT_767577 [Mycena maculata]